MEESKVYMLSAILLGTVLLLILIQGFTIYYQHNAMHSMMHGSKGGMLPMFGTLSMPMLGVGWNFLFFIFILIFLFIFLFLVSGEGKEKEEKAIEILKQRYARGEITREEYLQALKDLKEGKE